MPQVVPSSKDGHYHPVASIIYSRFTLLLEFLENSWVLKKIFKALKTPRKFNFCIISWKKSLNFIDDELHIKKINEWESLRFPFIRFDLVSNLF